VSEAEVPTAIPVSGADGRGPAAQAYTTSRGVLCMKVNRGGRRSIQVWLLGWSDPLARLLGSVGIGPVSASGDGSAANHPDERWYIYIS
jgi:hypothetical protein